MRLVGNDKVPPDQRLRLRYLKALRQGLMLRSPRWWPELEGLPPVIRARVKAEVRDHFVWAAALPRYTVDGRRIA